MEERLNVTKIILGILIALTVWDVLTTYYGTLSAFAGFDNNIMQNLGRANGAQHITSLLFAVAVVTLIICYRHILKFRNWFTRFILYAAFFIDFVTSFYGTASATISVSTGVEGLQWVIVTILAIITTAAPIFLHQVMESTGTQSDFH